MDDLEFESWQKQIIFIFSKTFRLATYEIGAGFFFFGGGGGGKGRGHELVLF